MDDAALRQPLRDTLPATPDPNPTKPRTNQTIIEMFSATAIAWAGDSYEAAEGCQLPQHDIAGYAEVVAYAFH